MNRRRLRLLARVLVLVVALCAATGAMHRKEGWHIDEIATLGLANGSIGGYITAYDDARFGRGAFIRDTILGDSFGEMAGNIGAILSDIARSGLSGFSIRDQYVAYREAGSPVWKSGEDFSEYLLADGFSLKDVYLNQLLDTHPPLYYLFVRAAYAVYDGLSGEEISLRPAFFVNALFLCLVCLMLMRIGEKRFGSFSLGAGAALFFALSPAGLSLAVYMRMYMALCFFVLLSLDAHLRLWQNGWQLDKKTAWALACSCALGFLTHYYFAIWAVMCALVCLLCMLRAKAGRRFWGYVGRMALGAALSLVVWPFSAAHLLLSNRSAQAVESLSGGALSRMGSSLNIFTDHLFGTPALVPLLLAAVGAGLYLLRKKERGPLTPLVISLAPAALYLAVVFVISPYEDLRYMACAVPLFALGAAWCLRQAAKCTPWKGLVCAALCGCVALSGLCTQSPMYLYPGTAEATAFVQQHAGKKCIYLTGSGAAFFREMPHFAHYESVLIVNRDELRLLQEDETLSAEDELLLYIHDSYPQTDAMHAILELTGFTGYEVLAQSHAGLDARAYLLTR
ncbi:MAG: hypothetical protein Q4A66_01795 [Eubacteriales bacterium]|nr:hypothetical protein [Eubacteriales bacterium]